MTDINDLAAGNLFVTGELGSGKTMYAVKLIREYLRAGRPVATNLDLFLDEMLPPDSRATCIRIPDKPVRAHFDALGDAYPMRDESGKDIYDERQFGLIVLDECLTWLNSRGWQDKERAGVLDWFLHARKHGWNIVFLMQSADYCDPQLRETLLTYHISCRKMGKYRIPIVGKAFGMRLPKGTLATTTAGYGANAIDHDKELYRGTELYSAYKTRQVFTSGHELIGGEFVDMRASFTMLSAWHLRGRYIIKDELTDVQHSLIDLSLVFHLLLSSLITAIKPLIILIIFPFYPIQVLNHFFGSRPRNQENTAYFPEVEPENKPKESVFDYM
jgi:hypothetical protein